MFELIQGDCLEKMRDIPDGSINMVLADPPYGTTDCKWDSVVDLGAMWKQLNRVIKTNGVIVLFGSEPFSSTLRMSNIKNYKYDIIWDKVNIGNPLNAKKMPLKSHENISIFYKKLPTYKPQKTDLHLKRTAKQYKVSDNYSKGKSKEGYTSELIGKYPKSILKISNYLRKNKLHPTQKPIALMEYLIKTYTNAGETVLDFTMGSGTTGVACANLSRRFIGIELDEKYFKIAYDRIYEAYGGDLLN